MAVWPVLTRNIPAGGGSKAARAGLYMNDGQQYNTHTKDYNALRFGFASLTEEELLGVVEVLTGIL